MKLDRLRPFLVGLCMGAADVIPGVSGGTIAFITGIYDKLVESFAHIDKQLYTYLINAQRKKSWKYIHGGFLVQVLGGVILAILMLAKIMTFLLENHTMFVFSFFVGLIIASIRYIGKQINFKKHKITYISVIIGIGLGYLATANTSIEGTTNPGLVSIFVAGMITSTAMILPGISGSYILVLLGKYAYILGTLSDWIDSSIDTLRGGSLGAIFNESFGIIVVFASGVGIGLLVASRILHRLLHHYRDITLALLLGCMIGALHVIWPWSTVLSSSEIIISGLLCMTGAAIIIGLTTFATIKKTTS